MADARRELSGKYRVSNRYSNFGAVINSVHIRGFRGVDAEIRFEYPVTALTGFNGSGKSTIGQLLLCGYRAPITAVNYKRHYVANFFPVSVADPAPFSDDASVRFRYQADDPDAVQELTVSRKVKEWSGYKRQPERHCEYIGFTVYLPKVERRDLTIYNAKSIALTERNDVANSRATVSKILGTAYDDVYFQGVRSEKRRSELGVVRRFDSTYSENNMGFGEGRVVHSIRVLETCPEQSLIVLEEPETSLHEVAQYKFAKYLMDVSSRRSHQIVFSTHSSVMMDALPPEARKLLVRGSDGVAVYDRISSARVRTALSDGHQGHAIVCVEDEFAQSLLREFLRIRNKELLKAVSILPFGDAKSVVSAKNALTKSGVRAVAVRDGDQSQSVKEEVFKLPGDQAPEQDVFQNQRVRDLLNDSYGVSFEQMIAAEPDLDHHEFSGRCTKKANCSREVLEADCIRAFLQAVPEEWGSELLRHLHRALN